MNVSIELKKNEEMSEEQKVQHATFVEATLASVKKVLENKGPFFLAWDNGSSMSGKASEIGTVIAMAAAHTEKPVQVAILAGMAFLAEEICD